MERIQTEVSRLSEQIKNGALSVEEVVSYYRHQIEQKEKNLQAFLTISDAGLQERIKEVQDGIDKGRYTGLLAGIPIAVKDNICTKGIRTTCASKMLENYIPTYDATVIRRLEQAGVIVLGKTNMDEYAMGSTTETSAMQVTKNPWNTEHTPGGSSGGSAVAVAAGMAPLALGSDTGGSVRQPASFCGITGLLPTYGRISRYGLVAYASSLDQIGPMGRTVADCKLLYEAIAGYDALDATTAKEPVTGENDETKTIKGMRIGIPREYMHPGIDKEVRDAVKQVAAMLEQAGAIVEEMSLPMTDYGVAAYYLLACAQASSNLARFDGVKYGMRAREEQLHAMYRESRSRGFGEEVKRRVLLGAFVLSEGYYDAYYLKALKARRKIKEDFEQAFRKYDCLLTPTAPATAPKLGVGLTDPMQMYLSDATTVAVNLAGLPAISVPCGFDTKGLPIGVQFIGNAFCEETLFIVGSAYETMRGTFPSPTSETEGRR